MSQHFFVHLTREDHAANTGMDQTHQVQDDKKHHQGNRNFKRRFCSPMNIILPQKCLEKSIGQIQQTYIVQVKQIF
ncbi:MAG: hypothetical protein BWX80_00501 [Candidatus Hydrogenedentes bacterium ADurb.Bin101]|nr:MAG: hypothetical protein BWX80_00501 [Candidatus Hydrogenedentes bacterium ADurb.Bin101]